MPGNISGPWVKMHGWNHLHTQDCLSIDRVKVPLTKSRLESQQSHQLYALSSVELGFQDRQETVPLDGRGAVFWEF